MVVPVPRAKKMMMFFGPHTNAYIPQFRESFRRQEHPGKIKTLILEAGLVSREDIVRVGGEAARQEIQGSIQARRISAGLSDALSKVDKLHRETLFEIFDDERKGKLPDHATFIATVMREAAEKGYHITSERLNQEALLNSWLEHQLMFQIIEECFYNRSADFQRALQLMREQYRCFYMFHTLRDEQLLGFMDVLAERNDTVSTIRGIGHINFFRGLSDPPRIFTYAEGPVSMGEIIARRMKPEELTALDMASIVKYNVRCALVIANASGQINCDDAESTKLIGRLPDDLTELQKFCLAVRDPDRSKMARKMIERLSEGKWKQIYRRLSQLWG